MPAGLPVRGDIIRIKPEMLEFQKIHGCESEFQHTLKYVMVLVQGIHYLQPCSPPVPRLPVVISVFTTFAAEFPVCPPIMDLVTALKACGWPMLSFSLIVHGIRFWSGPKM